MIDAPMSRTNYLLGAVNWKVPIESLDIRSEDERQQYFVFLEEAERHMEEYGF